VYEAPTIEITPADPQWIDREINSMREDRADDAIERWVIVTSANAVDALADRVDALGLDARVLAGRRVACVGPGTASALRARLGVRADLLPGEASSAGLARELIATGRAAGASFTLFRADIADPAPVRLLREAGAARVSEVIAYRTAAVKSFAPHVLAGLREGAIHVALFTSGSTVRNLHAALGDAHTLMRDVPCVTIGPRTTSAAREAGLTVAAEARRPTLASLVEAVLSLQNGSAV
jgi:uroporphyrinogen III methyltransferase/synthase